MRRPSMQLAEHGLIRERAAVSDTLHRYVSRRHDPGVLRWMGRHP